MAQQSQAVDAGVVHDAAEHAGDFMDRLAGYYSSAPQMFWAFIGLIIFTGCCYTLIRIYGRRRD